MHKLLSCIIFSILFFVHSRGYALSGQLVVNGGYESINHKSEGDYKSAMAGFSLSVLYALPIVSLSSQSSVFAAVGLHGLKASGETTEDSLVLGKYTIALTETAYFADANLGFRFSGQSVSVEIFGIYSHGLGGDFKFAQTWKTTNYTSSVNYKYVEHSQVGGGARFYIPWQSGMSAGLEANYYLTKMEIKDTFPGSIVEEKPSQVGKAIKVLIVKKLN